VTTVVDIGWMDTAVGSDGLGRGGRWRMADGAGVSQYVSGILQQLRVDSGGSPMWRLLLMLLIGACVGLVG
jgi:hypothetical protein